MSDHCPPSDARKVAAHRDGARGRFFLGVAVLMIRSGELLAADQTVTTVASPVKHEFRQSIPIYAAPFNAHLSAALSPVPREYALPPLADEHALTDPHTFSDTEFRPRGRSMFDKDPAIGNANDSLMIDRTVWQRLQEYRNHDRVRVMTLWESGASAVSIQTDRKGDPSLQWTSRLMNRGGATRGLLDRWSPVSVFRSFARPGSGGGGKSVPSAGVLPHPGMAAIP